MIKHVQNQLEKLDLLEQEYNKLTTMQALAEKKKNARVRSKTPS